MKKFFSTVSVLALFFFAVSVSFASAAENSARNKPHTARASWYGHDSQGKRMANGDSFNMRKLTVAHKTLPLGTQLKLLNPENGKTVVATVTDRGPYVKGRDIDLSRAAAKKLGILDKGIVRIQVAIVAVPSAEGS